MPKLINISDNLQVDVPDSSATEGFLAGRYALPKGIPQVMSDSEGRLRTVAPEEVHKAITEGGYRFAPDAAVHDANMEARYGGGLGAVQAAGLGAAETATFGVANHVLSGSGLVSKEALEELPKRHPVATAVGEVAGIAGGLLLAPEASAAGLIEKAGLGASKALLKAAPEGANIAGRIAANAARKGLGSAVEGALYQTGHEISEAALGNPDQNAERVMAHIGMSALLAGGLGGAFGTAEEVLPAALSKAKDAMQGLRAKAGPKVAESFDKAASFVSGQPKELITLIRENRAELGAGPEQVREFADSLSKGLQDQYSAMNKATKEAFKDLRPEESARLVANVEVGPVFDELSRISDKLQIAIRDLRAAPELYPARYASKLEEVTAAFTKELVESGSSVDAYKALESLKSNLSKQIKFGKLPSEEAAEAQAFIKTLRHDIKSSLENEQVWGEAGARQSAFNSVFNEFKTTQDELQSKFMRKVRTKQGGIEYKVDPVKVNTFLNQVGDIRGEARSAILDNYSKQSEAVLEQIERSYKNLPEKSYDSESLKNLVKRVSGVTEEFEGKAAVKRAYEKLIGTGGYGSIRGGGVGDVGAALAVTVAKAAGVPYSVAAPVVGLYEILRYPSTAMQRLAKLEGILNKADLSLERGAKAIFSGSKIAGPMGYELSSFDEKVNKINHLTANPEALLPKMEALMEPLYNNAPNTATALQASTMRGASFLKSKVPSAPAQYPLQMPWKPNATEKAQFMRYWHAVERPIDAYKQIKNGTLSKETVEVLQNVYPALYKQMQSHIVDALTSHRKPVPYSTKLQLSLFMQQDMTASTVPQSILFNQQLLSGAAQPKPAIKPSSNTKQMRAAERMLTPMQAASARR